MKGFRLDRAVPQIDVDRILEDLTDRDVEATDKDAYELWVNYSVHSGHGWLSLPADGEELNRLVTIALRLKTTEWYL